MKIALLVPWFLPNRGGAEIGAWELTRRLVKKGHQVSVVTPRYRFDWPSREEVDGVKIFRYISKFPPMFRRLGEVAHCLQAFPGVFHLLNKIQPDVVHLQYLFFTGYAGMCWAKCKKKPVVLTLVGNDVYDPYYIPCEFLHGLNKWVIHNVDEVACASRFVRDVVKGKFKYTKREISVLPYGVDLETFKPIARTDVAALRRKLGLPSDKSLILTVQRLHERKGVHIYLQAAEQVLKKNPNAFFVVVGDGPERARLESLACSLNIADHVLFTGRQKDELLPAYYQVCDLFAFHTFHEGFGIVLLEAMASGLPILTTRAGGTVDIVEPGKHGSIVEPNNPGELAKSILEFLDDPTTGYRVAQGNRQWAEREYSWNIHADRYEALYQKVLNPSVSSHN